MRRFIFFFCFVFCVLSLPSLAKRLTGGFRIAKMELHFPHRAEWETEVPPEINAILSQNFSFLGKGAQCYAFESRDGQFVIKLFRYDHPVTESKVFDLFNACKLAYDHLKEETGLIYVHLNVTNLNLPPLHCTDAVGRTYQFDLDKMRFAIQKKAVDFFTALEIASPFERRQKMSQFIDLLKKRTEKKIRNADPSLSRNFGFLQDRAVEIDFGNYRPAPELDSQKEMARFSSKLQKWLEKNHPEDLAFFEESLQ